MVKVRDIVHKPDKLFDFMINYELGGRTTSVEMKANEYKSYSTIIDIAITNKEKGIQALRQYLSKQWVKDYKKWVGANRIKVNIISTAAIGALKAQKFFRV